MERELKISSVLYKGTKVYYRVGTEDEKVLNHSFGKDIFFKEVPSFNPTEHPIIIDVGAHIGTFSLLSLIRYPEAVVYAYEPSFASFEILERNRKENGLDRLNIFHQAVSGSEGTARLFHSDKTGNWGHSITKSLSSSFEEVKTTTLESIVIANKIGFIDLIKFNCEGAEFVTLLNAPHHVIKKIGLGIILYHEDLDQRIGNVNKLVDLFKGLNFRVVVTKRGPDRGWLIVWNKRAYSWFYFIRRALIRRMKR